MNLAQKKGQKSKVMTLSLLQTSLQSSLISHSVLVQSLSVWASFHCLCCLVHPAYLQHNSLLISARAPSPVTKETPTFSSSGHLQHSPHLGATLGQTLTHFTPHHLQQLVSSLSCLIVVMTNFFSLTYSQLLIPHSFLCHPTHFLSFTCSSFIHMLTHASVTPTLLSHILLLANDSLFDLP